MPPPWQKWKKNLFKKRWLPSLRQITKAYATFCQRFWYDARLIMGVPQKKWGFCHLDCRILVLGVVEFLVKNLKCGEPQTPWDSSDSVRSILLLFSSSKDHWPDPEFQGDGGKRWDTPLSLHLSQLCLWWEADGRAATSIPECQKGVLHFRNIRGGGNSPTSWKFPALGCRLLTTTHNTKQSVAFADIPLASCKQQGPQWAWACMQVDSSGRLVAGYYFSERSLDTIARQLDPAPGSLWWGWPRAGMQVPCICG